MMTVREFLYEWRNWGFRVAVNNWVFMTAAHVLDAKKMTVTYHKK